MRHICSREKMQEIDKTTIEQFGIGALVLMERAALAVCQCLQDKYEKGSKCMILAGAGNNGGDGLALARILYEAGWQVHVFLLGNRKRSDECETQLGILQKMVKEQEGEGLYLSELITTEEISALSSRQYDVIVDSIFGIGLTRDLVSPEKDVIEAVNTMDGYKVALDIASGLDADTGCVRGTVFMADLTLTFGYEKQGMYMCEGPEVSGEIVTANIGFPRAVEKQAAIPVFTYDRTDISRLPKRKKTSNKGTYGRVAVIAGCETMAGAAYFSAAGAYRSGAGLVKVYSHSTNRSILLSKLPEAVYEAYDGDGLPKSENGSRVVASAVQFADVLVVGPGIGKGVMAESLVKAALSQSEVPVVLDADGLNILSEHMDWLEYSRTELILTPHFREMERLLGCTLADIRRDTMEVARTFAKEHHVVCVLKGAHTIVADDGETAYINTTGNNGMSTGGTGDVLTGIIAAFVAAGLSCVQAARLGVMVHGMAGDETEGIFGKRGMLAGDMLENIGKVLREIK